MTETSLTSPGIVETVSQIRLKEAERATRLLLISDEASRKLAIMQSLRALHAAFVVYSTVAGVSIANWLEFCDANAWIVSKSIRYAVQPLVKHLLSSGSSSSEKTRVSEWSAAITDCFEAGVNPDKMVKYVEDAGGITALAKSHRAKQSTGASETDEAAAAKTAAFFAEIASYEVSHISRVASLDDNDCGRIDPVYFNCLVKITEGQQLHLIAMEEAEKNRSITRKILKSSGREET